MKYIRTYGDYESYKAEYSDTSRGFRLKPTLYKYSEAGDHIVLETDDPRKHEGSTWFEFNWTPDYYPNPNDSTFRFYIGNKSGDNQTTMTCTVDWGDGTVESKTIEKDEYGYFLIEHEYATEGMYCIELYDTDRAYAIVGRSDWASVFESPSSINRTILGDDVVEIGREAFSDVSAMVSLIIPSSVSSLGTDSFYNQWYRDIKTISLYREVAPKGVREIVGNRLNYLSGEMHIKRNATGYEELEEAIKSSEYSDSWRIIRDL